MRDLDRGRATSSGATRRPGRKHNTIVKSWYPYIFMADETPYLGLNLYELDDEPWTHSEDMRDLDNKVILADTFANRPDPTDIRDMPNHAWFFATDRQIFYQYEEGSDSWRRRGGLGEDGNPLPQAWYEALVTTGDVVAGDDLIATQDVDVGRAIDQPEYIDIEDRSASNNSDNYWRLITWDDNGRLVFQAWEAGSSFDAQILYKDGSVEFPNGLSVTGTVDPDAIDNQDYNEAVESISAGSSQTLDLSVANWFEVELTADTDFSFSATGAAGNSFLLALSQDSTGGHSPTWPASVTWHNGVTPDPPGDSETLELSFTSPDGGTSWRGRESWRA